MHWPETFDEARLGGVWVGEGWHGAARYGQVDQARRCGVRHGAGLSGVSRRGKADMARRVTVRLGLFGSGKADLVRCGEVTMAGLGTEARQTWSGAARIGQARCR